MLPPGIRGQDIFPVESWRLLSHDKAMASRILAVLHVALRTGLFPREVIDSYNSRQFSPLKFWSQWMKEQ
jgi:hypothetical protein